MKPACPSCHQEVPVEDVNLETGLGRCRFCNEIFEIPELVTHIRAVQAGSPPGSGGPPPMRPADSRIKLIKRDNRLLVYLPPWGFFSPVLVLLLFSLFWLGFVAFWTAGALGVLTDPAGGPRWENIMFSLFSIPFWLVGLGMLVGALSGMFSRRVIYLDESRLENRWELGFLKYRKTVSRADVQTARVASAPLFQRSRNDRPTPSYGVEIVYQGGKISIPCENEDEQNWLLAEVRSFLETVPYRPETFANGSVDEAFRELTSEG